MCLYMRGDEQGRYSDLGEIYFDEFNSRFWLRPGNNLRIVSINYIYIMILSLFIFLRYTYTTSKKDEFRNPKTEIRRMRNIN